MRRVSLAVTIWIFWLAAALAQTSEPPQVKTAVLGAAGNTVVRQFFGTVVARETVDLAFQVSGQVVDFPVLEGVPIGKGALIAQLDLEPFELALARAEAEKNQADRNLARYEQLEGGTVSEAQVLDARTAAQLAAIAVTDAERALRLATLRAPFDALIAVRNVANFTTVQAGSPVVRLHDISEWRVEIEVPEVLFRQAGEDPDITLTLGFPGDSRRIPLETREFNAQTSGVGQTLTITLALVEDPGPGVLPGSSATVYAELRNAVSLPAVPPSAIITAPDGSTSVMVFEPSGEGDAGTVRATTVTITAGPNGQLLVTEGVAPGAEIVAAGASMLEDGQAVRRFTGFSG